MDIKRIEESMLLLEDDEFEDAAPNFVHNFLKGEFCEILNSSDCKEIFAGVIAASCDEPLEELLDRGAQWFLDKEGSDPKEALRLLCVGAAALCAWLQEGQCGPPLATDISWLVAARGAPAEVELEAHAALERPAHGDACGSMLPQPLLLLLARAALRHCASVVNLETGAWWWMRTLFVHQRVLKEPVQSLHEQLTELLDAGLPGVSAEGTRAALWVEVARVHLWYGHLVPAHTALEKARKAAGVSMHLIGAMGKRTRFQQREVAQLTLQVEIEENREQVLLPISESLPKDVQLQDEVLLAKVEYSREGEHVMVPTLSPMQQAVVLTMVSMLQRSQPQDELAHEELLPYLQVVLGQPQSWSLQAAALVLRSRLESKRRRTAERAMLQIEELVSAVQCPSPGAKERLRGLFVAPLPLLEEVRCDLANALVQLGCVQSALDLFLELHQWEAAVMCYTMLDLRHLAAELLQRELAVKETVPLLCLLGDATDDTGQYERAWELSGRRSARAQRHWGMHHFRHKEYSASISHLQLSLQCNSLQPELWQRLGYAALEIQDWSLCASAYRRCVELEPENVEAWNNLAKSYVKTGQKERAWHALQEALKVDFENWRLWDNVAAVSADVGAFDEVLRAYHRLLDLRAGRHVDVPVLRALVSSVVGNLKDCSGQNAVRFRPQVLALFGRITSQVTTDAEVWHLYAQLTASLPEQTPQTLERTAQHLQKAHRAATQQQGWAKQRDSCSLTLSLSSQLADVYLSCCQVQPNRQRFLTSARLALKSVLAAVKQEVELAQELSSEVEELEGKLAAVEEQQQAVN